MQCSIVLESDCNRGNVNMKTLNNFKNPYKKESNLDNIVDQLCTRLQDIKDQEGASRTGMPICSIEHTEAVRRYYAAFPALKKGQESPLQYYLPPPAWCRKSAPDTKIKMQGELSMSKDWNSKNKKYSGKERRNSYHGQRKNNRKRCNSYSRSFESKENLPEWVTHEGVWDMETQDPVKEFIRAIAFDEGYGTCENTVTDEIKEITKAKFRLNENMVPEWDDNLNFGAEWVFTEDLNPRVRSPMEEELYAKFEAKFDRSIEALWSKDQNTPDDEYQDLPIDFHDLLSSPSDHLFADPSAEKCSLISLTESIWSTDAADIQHAERQDTASKIADGLHDRFKPLNIGDAGEPECPRELESFSLYEGEELYDALSTVAKTMRSYTAINHSRDRSGFAEVPPRKRRPELASLAPPAPVPEPPALVATAAALAPAPPQRTSPEREDLLTSSRTHFRPIRREADAEPARYADGDTFDIRGDLDRVEFERSESGGAYLGDAPERYLEYRDAKGIDYGRLKLTPAQRCPDLDDPGFRLRFPMRQIDVGVQTERPAEAAWPCEECGRAAKKMRPSAIDSIWSQERAKACECAPPPAPPARSRPHEDLSREWEELLRDISAAHRQYAVLAGGEPEAEADVEAEGETGAGAGVDGEAGEEALVSADRKRRHSAALRCAAAPLACSHPHARFLHCCAAALDRPLTR